MANIPSELLDAYHRTTYTASARDDAGNKQILLRINEPCAELDTLLEHFALRNWAYLTACNPHSTLMEPEENVRRQAALVALLKSESYIVFPGHSIADADDWPVEQSALVIGLGAERAKEIATEFGQYGFLYGERGGMVRLVLCDTDSV